MRATPRVDEAVQRLKDTFLAMPGTEMTVGEASRMTGLEHFMCNHILMALEDVHFLRRRGDGVFICAHVESPHL